MVEEAHPADSLIAFGSRSPLMHSSFRGSWRLTLEGAVAFGLIASLACVSRNGRNYWAWNDPGFWAETTCETAQPGETPLVRAHVADDLGFDLPGATVRFRRSDSSSVSEGETNTQGMVCASIGPGHWQVEARLPGFRTAHYDLEVPQGQACSVSFRLSLAESDEQTVTEKR